MKAGCSERVRFGVDVKDGERGGWLYRWVEGERV